MTFMRHIASAAARRPRTTSLLRPAFVAGCPRGARPSAAGAAIVTDAVFAILASVRLADDKPLEVADAR